MSAEGRPVRLFLALDLPEEPRAALSRWRDAALAGREDLRPVAEEALHVTLAFLGWTAPERVASAWDAAETAADGHPPARLSFVSVKAVPPRRPRLFAVDLGDEGGRAGALHAALSDALQAAGLYEPERRAFWPHVTVARVRRGGRAAAPTAAPLPGEAFDAPSLTLYRSELSPAGARYTVLERLELRGR